MTSSIKKVLLQISYVGQILKEKLSFELVELIDTHFAKSRHFEGENLPFQKRGQGE